MTKSAAIVAAFNSALALLLAFGVDLSQEQQLALVGMLNAALVLAAVILDPKIPFGVQEKPALPELEPPDA